MVFTLDGLLTRSHDRFRFTTPAKSMTPPTAFLRALVLIGLTVTVTTSGTTKPNLIFIMADDLGYTDVGCFGSKYYETPHIDRLAAQGMRFDQLSSTLELHAYARGIDERPVLGPDGSLHRRRHQPI